jgi:hypothetical protein
MIPNSKPGPIDMLITYRAKKGHEDALLAFVKKHWPMLDRLHLATEQPARIWRAVDREGRTSFVEMFQWKDASASGIAHQTPEVMAVWEPMGNIMEGMEIAQIEPVNGD